MLGVIDYGVGNLFSLTASLRSLGADITVSGDKSVLSACDRLILPGVGAFGDAAAILSERGLKSFVKDRASEIPVLGICLGMQLLFEESTEYGVHEGLGLIEGKILPLADNVETAGLKIPHIGWNKLRVKRPCPLLKYTDDGEYFYYVHSYYADGRSQSCAASSDYGIEVAGVVERGNVFGTQFHPEKSGSSGLKILRAFMEL